MQHNPDHARGLLLMGIINMNHLKDIDAAEQNFLKILQTDPNHALANYHLCVVYVKKGDLHRAEKCLVAAAKLAPHEEYIQEHLQIVRKHRQGRGVYGNCTCNVNSVWSVHEAYIVYNMYTVCMPLYNVHSNIHKSVGGESYRARFA